jgi:DNA polymerase-3 subunit delta'
MLKPLEAADVAAAAAAALGPDADEAALVTAAQAAGGSVAQAIALAGGPLLALRQRVEAMLDALPATDPNALHALGDQLDRDRSLLDAFVGAVRDWLRRRLDAEVKRARPDRAHLAGTADLWDKLNRSARDVEIYNLDKKPLVFAIFGLLAEASRG